MGRYYFDSKATLGECKSLGVTFLKKHGYLKPESRRYGGIRWSRSGEETGNVDFWVDTENMTIRFIYSVKDRSEGENDWIDKDYTYSLATTSCHFGGMRYWFVCHFCQRRVGALHLYGRNDFACRHCLNLSYESRNTGRNYRVLDYYFKNLKIGEEIAKIRVKHYKGQPTRKMQKLLKKFYRYDAFTQDAERFVVGI